MIKDELLEVHLTDKLLDLLFGRSILDCVMTYPVMERTIVVCPGSLRIGREESRAPHPRLVLDGAQDPISGNPEWNEVGIHSVDFNSVPKELN